MNEWLRLLIMNGRQWAKLKQQTLKQISLFTIDKISSAIIVLDLNKNELNV